MTGLSRKLGALQAAAEAMGLASHVSEIEVDGAPVVILTLSEPEPVKLLAPTPEAIRRELLKQMQGL